MNRPEQVFQPFQKEQTAMLATASGPRVTMRVISPVCYQDKILFFTWRKSMKYQQLEENPRCCISAGNVFVEAVAEFRGSTMTDENEALRKVYCEKFPGAFDEGVEFGGRGADFVLLKPAHVKGWAFQNDTPTSDGIPTVPFEFDL